MHATRSQNLGGLNADAVLHAMWQKMRALIEKCGSLTGHLGLVQGFPVMCCAVFGSEKDGELICSRLHYVEAVSAHLHTFTKVD